MKHDTYSCATGSELTPEHQSVISSKTDLIIQLS